MSKSMSTARNDYGLKKGESPITVSESPSVLSMLWTTFGVQGAICRKSASAPDQPGRVLFEDGAAPLDLLFGAAQFRRKAGEFINHSLACRLRLLVRLQFFRVN